MKDIKCIPQSKVYHLGGASLDKSRPKKTFLNFRNNLVMLLKNLLVYALPIIFIRLVLDGLAGIKFLKKVKLVTHLPYLKPTYLFTLKYRVIMKRRKSYYFQIQRINFNRLLLKGKKRFNDLNW